MKKNIDNNQQLTSPICLLLREMAYYPVLTLQDVQKNTHRYAKSYCTVQIRQQHDSMVCLCYAVLEEPLDRNPTALSAGDRTHWMYDLSVNLHHTPYHDISVVIYAHVSQHYLHIDLGVSRFKSTIPESSRFYSPQLLVLLTSVDFVSSFIQLIPYDSFLNL